MKSEEFKAQQALLEVKYCQAETANITLKTK